MIRLDMEGWIEYGWTRLEFGHRFRTLGSRQEVILFGFFIVGRILKVCGEVRNEAFWFW